MSKTVGSRLKEVRQHLQMSQAEFGKRLGVSGSTVAKHESGWCFPTGKMLNILAFQYHISMDYLLCGRGAILYEEPDQSKPVAVKDIISGDKDMEELFLLVSHVPMVRHSLLGYFHRFKAENRQLIEKELAENTALTLKSGE